MKKHAEDFYTRKFEADLENDRVEGTMNPAMRESEVVSSEERVVTAGSRQIEGKPPVLLQVNSRSILNKILEFWNLVDTYNLDVIIGTESWLREEINTAEVFREDYTTLTSVVCKQIEHVIASYLRQVWDKNDWLYEGQHGFRPGYSCESQVITDCQDIADSMDNGDRIDAVVIDFSKVFDLVPHDRLLTNIAISGVDSRVVAWVREFLLGRTQRFRVGRQLSEEARVTSGVPPGSVLGTPVFLAYVDNIW